MSQVFIKNFKKNNQGKNRGLLFSGHGLSAQPYIKQPCYGSMLPIDGKAHFAKAISTLVNCL